MSKQEIDVQIVNAERRCGFCGALMGLGLALWLWKFLLLVAILLAIASVGAWATVIWQERRSNREAILQRCDQQHAWVMKGDLRGTYGPWYGEQDYPTMVLCNSAPPRGPVPKRPEDRIRIVDGETVERHQ